MHASIQVLCERGSKPTVYHTLWVLGAVLILVSIPCFQTSGAFYTLLSFGVACVLVGVLLWSYNQQSASAPVKQVMLANHDGGITSAAQVPSLPIPELIQNTAMGQTLLSQGLPPNYVMEPTMETAKPALSKPDTKTKTNKPKTKKKLRVDDKTKVKEYVTTDAPNLVASAPATVMQTKDGKILYVPNGAHMPAYPNLEDIRMERERFNNRPETPDLDRHRRVGMMQEFALAMPPERNGYMIPIISQATSG